MSPKILQTIAKPFITKIPSPWDKVFSIISIIIILPSVFCLLVMSCWFICMFILEYMMDKPTIDLMVTFLIFPLITITILLIHHVLSKTKSVSKLVCLGIYLIFLEIIAYFWFSAYRWDHFFHTEGGEGYVLTTTDRLEMILTYVKALFQTVALSLVLIVGRLFIKKHTIKTDDFLQSRNQ